MVNRGSLHSTCLTSWNTGIIFPRQATFFLIKRDVYFARESDFCGKFGRDVWIVASIQSRRLVHRFDTSTTKLLVERAARRFFFIVFTVMTCDSLIDRYVTNQVWTIRSVHVHKKASGTCTMKISSWNQWLSPGIFNKFPRGMTSFKWESVASANRA